MKKTILYLVAIVALSSCTLQKRLYNNGYYVAWQGKHAKQTTAPVQHMVAKSPQLTIAQNPLPNVNLQIRQTAMACAKQAPIKAKSNNKPATPAKRSFNFMTAPLHIGRADMPGMARVHPKANAAIIFGIIAMFTYWAAFLFGALAIVFGLWAISEIRKNPDTYRGEKRARWGYILGIIACVAVLILLVAL